MSISKPKLGFGHEKQKMMLELLEKLKGNSDPFIIEARKMATDSLKNYLEYHKKHGYTDKMIEKIEKVVGVKESPKLEYGGVTIVHKSDLKFDTKEIERFINSRHSIRDFAETDVNEDDFMKALILAQRAPSACNRQGYRVHILSKENSKEYAKHLSGIGGFADSVNRFLMITGKLSAYREDEINQYIVFFPLEYFLIA